MSEQQQYPVLVAALQTALENLRSAYAPINTWDKVSPEQCRCALTAVEQCKAAVVRLEPLCLSSGVLRIKFDLLKRCADDSCVKLVAYSAVCHSFAEKHVRQRLTLRQYLQDEFIDRVQSLLSVVPQVPAAPQVTEVYDDAKVIPLLRNGEAQ